MRLLIPVLVIISCSEPVGVPEPADPGYDPVAYRSAGDRSMREVVWSEPRDDSWAFQRERDIAFIIPFGFASIWCRTSSCTVTARVPDSEVDAVLAAVPRLGPVTDVEISGTDSGTTRLEIYALFPPSLRGHGDYAAWLESQLSIE